MEKLITYLSAGILFIAIFWILIFGTSGVTGIIGIILLAISLIGLGFIIYYRFDYIKQIIKEFEWASYSLKTSYIIIIIGILVLINLIANKRFARFDLTAEQRYTLSDHTIKLFKEIKKLDKKIKIIFFRSEVSLLEVVDDLLKEYKSRCNNISLEFVDPDRNPSLAKEYNIRSIGLPYGGQRLYGTVVLLCEGKKEEVDVLKFDYRQAGGRFYPQVVLRENLEKEISSAILRITKSKKKIYFVEGHGEIDLEDESDTGFDKTKKYIADENYIIDKIYLPSVSSVPVDCDVLVIASPKKSYTQNELNLIDNYLNEGGHLLIMLDAFIEADFNPLLNKWGIKTSNKFIVDPAKSYWFQPIIPLITEYSYHKITEKLKYATFFPTVTPIEILDKKPEGVDIVSIAKTSPESWIENNINSKEVKFNPSEDKKGAWPIIVALEKKIDQNKSTRVVIVGDTDFASNYAISSYGNLDLLLNILNWLAGKEELIGIRGKEPQIREIMLTKERMNFVLYTSVLGLPILIIIAGVIVWWRRQNM